MDVGQNNWVSGPTAAPESGLLPGEGMSSRQTGHVGSLLYIVRGVVDERFWWDIGSPFNTPLIVHLAEICNETCDLDGALNVTE